MSDTIRNRICWDDEENSCLVDFGSAEAPDIHTMRWRTIPKTTPASSTKYVLVWDNVLTVQFGSLPSLKDYIVRLAYGIRDQYLVPSELLYDAGITYQDVKLWVDSWTEILTTENKYKLYDGIIGVDRPVTGNIRLSSLSKKIESKIAATKAYQAKRDRFQIPPHKPGEPHLIPIDKDWEDFAWEARVMGPLCKIPPQQPSDNECTYVISFPLFNRRVKRAKA